MNYYAFLPPPLQITPTPPPLQITPTKKEMSKTSSPKIGRGVGIKRVQKITPTKKKPSSQLQGLKARIYLSNKKRAPGCLGYIG